MAPRKKAGTEQKNAPAPYGSQSLKLAPDYPDHIKKTYGPVIDSVMGQELLEAADYLIQDDTDGAATGPLPVQTRVMLSYEGIDFDIQGRVSLTAFDREVIDAVASLASSNDLITAPMIYRIMMGKQDYQHVTTTQIRKVVDSMNKCAFTRIKLDLTDLYNQDSPVGKKLKQAGIQATFSGNLLSYEMVSIRRGKKQIDCYRILTEPAIVRYASELGKVSQFPIYLLDTQVSKTERTIILQSFLLRKIDEMYRDPTVSRTITTSDLYDAIEATDDTRQHKARYRTTALNILLEWVEKGFLQAVTPRKMGNTVQGYTITLRSEFIGGKYENGLKP